ncbi:ubiquitin [Desulfosporosinus hippei]|uniref:DUF4342 domain-containing protein n=1 Tax=Desulfosporosinus hippei DSM 8344 TaxID=1121419 RepID=A0A1G7W520_9FIRM|nr:ubiquitin [Desulfosporosinus hippei]SDG67076.1 hypothetical protein SAMN05443529_10532 [Desulfosporosinus hippei DSM 8344]
MTTLEQVEKLRSMGNISYDEAKSALDASNGDLLEAIIHLEKLGKLTPPTGGGYYSSHKTIDISAVACKDAYWDKHKTNQSGKTFMATVKGIWKFCLNLIQRGNANSLEVLKGEESKAVLPVTVLALLLIFAFWITIPLMILGFFFGFRYRFHGPDFKGRTVNQVMNSAADAAENLKKSMNK